jgi:hypothetical protein
MFANIVKHMDVMEFSSSELEQPISVMSGGGPIATVRDLIAAKAPTDVKALFGAADAKVSSQHVEAVAQLDPPSLRRVAVDMLRRSNPNHRVVAIGLGQYTPEQLIDEVEHGTVAGERVIEAVRLNGLFVEEAVTNGKVRPNEFHEKLHVPAFDF